MHDRMYGGWLYNALSASRLRLDAVSIVNEEARIALSGSFLQVGHCDDPRMEAQIRHTALQFRSVRRVSVTINGTPLAELLSEK